MREYNRLAGRYDRRWSFYVQSTVRETMRRLTVERSDRVLDIGCGTGALLQALRRVYPEVSLAGVDPSPEMLKRARQRLGSPVRLVQAWAERLAFQDASFDVVVSCSVFHYIRNPEKALEQMARVLKPGGRLVITDWCHDYLACRACDLVLRLVNSAHFRVYSRAACGRLLEESNFQSIVVDAYRINWLWGLMTATARKPCPSPIRRREGGGF